MPLPVEAENAPQRLHGRHLHLHPLLGFRHHFLIRRQPRLDIPPPEEGVPPAIEEPSGPSEEPPEQPPLPHGFALTVPVGGGRTAAVPASLRRYVEVGQALGACWNRPADVGWSSITLRVSFRRDGSVNGVPRVPFVDAAAPEQKSELARSLLAALKLCTPLPFSASLGSAIAGEIFAIRFINQDAR